MLSRAALQAAKRARAPRPLWATATRSSSYASSTTKFDRKEKRAIVELEDGTVLEGWSFGAAKSTSGEVVFTTGMVGYPESMTDPSYKGQVLVSTYPLIGNYGVPDRKAVDKWGLPLYFESDKIHVQGVIAQDYSVEYSHWNAASSLGEWMAEEGVPGVHGIDTRLLTKKLREKGALKGRIEVEGDVALADLPWVDPNARNLVAEVSRSKPTLYKPDGTVRDLEAGEELGAATSPLGSRPTRILAVDCGIKYNMIREFLARGCEVKVVPWDHKITTETEWYDGLFLSNGPGDPSVCAPLVEEVRQVLVTGNHPVKPTFGICLGNQVVGQAAGCATYKMPFGNRGQNQPVINHLTGAAVITPQNHGYAIDTTRLPGDWMELFTNANDKTNEGVIHRTKPYFTAQFHPEARGGPVDTSFLFDTFLKTIEDKASRPVFPASLPPPTATGAGADLIDAGATKSATTVADVTGRVTPRLRPKKVLILGSGGLSIGQAGEFDYSGNQAIKALKEEGIEVVLMNPNIASVQTNHSDERTTAQADNVYFLPVTSDFIELVLKRERPDGILISMGGQTALNCGVDLHDRGVLRKYGTRVLGTSIDSIKASEDRELFADKLREIGEKLAQSEAVETVKDAVVAAGEIGYPVMIRSAYALGGLGSGICRDEAELRDMALKAFSVSPQILVERSLKGWKEVEYEVVRDVRDNCITVCNMENFDPLGIHTGESIVIAPSQTLSNEEYHMLRETAIKVVRHLGIVGECNIQYALDPHSLEYCIIEVNPRLSRSSALASKATGYPLAAVATKLSLNIPLPEIRNAVTGMTTACFEPSLDYVVTKIPRWDMRKFEQVREQIGSAMKSVGEVMAVGRSFEESFQKALRMVDPSIPGFAPTGDWALDVLGVAPGQAKPDPAAVKALLETELSEPTDQRPFALAHALVAGTHTVEELHDLTKIDHWFLARLRRIIAAEERMVAGGRADEAPVPVHREAAAGALGASIDLGKLSLHTAKKLGFSDKQIAAALNAGFPAGEGEGRFSELTVRAARKGAGIVPVTKQIDTLAAEYPAQTNYLYSTYNGSSSDVSPTGKGVVVLGSGTYRIGSSVEFDWCSVSCIRTLRALGQSTIVINYNPETVSTDYDESDRLYFEELSLERVLDVVDGEAPDGVIVSMGGQIPNNLALSLDKAGVRVLGTAPEQIDNAEDRRKFSNLMDSIGVAQPEWSELTTDEEARAFASRVGFPVLVRPSYVLSGAAMSVAQNDAELDAVLANAVNVSPDFPVVITKFMQGAMEIEFDGVARDGEIIAQAVSEHVEDAGVHSGDATLVLPPQTLEPYYIHRVRGIAAKVAKGLKITGPFNMQLLGKGADVSVIECNLRASRSFPFVSKTVGADFIEAATRAIMGASTAGMNLPGLDAPFKRPARFVGIKSPMFSFTRLRGADPVLGVEMASTGEVACFGDSLHEAFLKSLLSSNFRIPDKSVLLDIQEPFLHRAVHPAYKLHQLGFELMATPTTAAFLRANDIPATEVDWSLADDPAAHEEGTQTLLSRMQNKEVDLVINLAVPASGTKASGTKRAKESAAGLAKEEARNYLIRRAAVDYNIPLLTNANLFALFADSMVSLRTKGMVGLEPDSLYDHYARESDDDGWTGPREFH